MKKIFFYFLILLFATWLGVVIHNNPGYLIIIYRNITVETSLWLAIIALILLFILGYIVLRTSNIISSLFVTLRNWLKNRKKKRAHSQSVLAICDLIAGNFERAEKKFARFAKYSDIQLINYLAAALTAQKQNALKRQNYYLIQAEKIGSDQPITIGIVKAQLAILNQQWEESAIILRALQSVQPKNILILQLLKDVYLHEKRWHDLEKLIPLLRKRHEYKEQEIVSLEQLVYTNLLNLASQNNTIDHKWLTLSKHLQKDAGLAAIYTNHLIQQKRNDDAETILKITLRKILDPKLLDIYATLESTNPIKQLERAEKWLRSYSRNASLLLCLGKICRKQKLWGKTKDYLEASIKIQPTKEAYTELAEYLQTQNDLPGAINSYKKSLNL